jgi:hypothetical protein
MTDLRLKQYRLDSMLQFGIICSIVWMMGIGSLYAFLCGLRARSIIKASGGQLVGMGRAKWCIIVGGIGIAVWLPVLAVVVMRR